MRPVRALAIGVALAGDLITLFIFWELMAIGSTVVVWCGGPFAHQAGLRYASETRSFLIMSCPEEKSRLVCTVQVRYIMSRPRAPTFGM